MVIGTTGRELRLHSYHNPAETHGARREDATASGVEELADIWRLVGQLGTSAKSLDGRHDRKIIAIKLELGVQLRGALVRNQTLSTNML